MGAIKFMLEKDESSQLLYLNHFLKISGTDLYNFCWMAAHLCDTPYSCLMLLEQEYGLVQSSYGKNFNQAIPLDFSSIYQQVTNETVIISDLALLPGFGNQPGITGERCLSFFASTPFYTPDGHVQGLLCVLDRKSRSLTREQKEGLERLSAQVTDKFAVRQSEARFRLMAENSNDIIAQVSPQGKHLYVSPAYQTILGYTPSEVIGEDVLDHIHSDDLPIAAMALKTLSQPSATQVVQYRAKHKNGGYVWLETTCRSIADPDTGEVVEIQTVSRDIRERKQAEEALRQSEARFRFLAENGTDVIVRVDNTGTALYVTPSCYAMLGYSPEELIGRKLEEILHPHDIPQTEELIQNLTRGSSSVIIVARARCKNGNYKWLELSLRGVFDTQTGELLEIHASARDITERKRAEEDIHLALRKERELSELKSRFVSMTSHEFRTPLSTILSSAELLEHYGNRWSEEKKLDLLHQIETAVQHMTKLLDDILIIGKAEAGKMEFCPAPLDITTLCQNLVEEVQINSRRDHPISATYEEYQEPVYADAKLLRQVVTNLLSNAIKYSPEDSNVFFRQSYKEGALVIEVADSGIGIPAEDLPKLFELFHRGKNVGTIPGTGLGLSIVRKSVEVHGGNINVTSEAGSGTTFTVTIPLRRRV